MHPSAPRQAWPFIAGAIIAKKVAVLGIARMYGFPRVYRRMLELEKYVYPNADQAFKRSINEPIKQAIRYPDQALNNLSKNPAALAFIEQLTKIKDIKLGNATTNQAINHTVELLDALIKRFGIDSNTVMQMIKQSSDKSHKTK